jgi:hypothetical protein
METNGIAQEIEFENESGTMPDIQNLTGRQIVNVGSLLNEFFDSVFGNPDIDILAKGQELLSKYQFQFAIVARLERVFRRTLCMR